MNWKQQWIDEVLENIPAGSYRHRVEAELRDHLETQYCALTEAGRTMDEAQAEALRVMGEPDSLQAEYRAAWRRSLPGRLAALGYRLKTWAKGLCLMFGVHGLIGFVRNQVCSAAFSLSGNSKEPWAKLIWNTAGNLNNSWVFALLLPLTLALLAGAYYLGRKFRASPRPEWQISVGLFFYWAFFAAVKAWFRALDNHHRPFWEAVGRHFYYNARLYIPTFALCILLGVVFGRMSARTNRPAAA